MGVNLMAHQKRLIDIFSVSFDEIGAPSIPAPKKSRIVKTKKSTDKRETQ
jgi:hypothetical protein